MKTVSLGWAADASAGFVGVGKIIVTLVPWWVRECEYGCGSAAGSVLLVAVV